MEEHADIETSSEGYASRFAGPAGEWMLDVQTRHILDLLESRAGASILDVGGGHGQAAYALADAGYKVTVVGSDPVCAARLQSLIDRGAITYITGSLTQLPFPDQAFDVVLSVRLVPHCDAWPVLIRELCRVASDAVIVDYPCVESINCLAGLFFARKQKIERNTRTWITFRHRQIRQAFEHAGFSRQTLRKQFFWPMVLHRMLNRPTVSRLIEGIAAMIGLRALFGSPVLIRAQRETPAMTDNPNTK